jgi:hypothetical protein
MIAEAIESARHRARLAKWALARTHGMTAEISNLADMLFTLEQGEIDMAISQNSTS